MPKQFLPSPWQKSWSSIFRRVPFRDVRERTFLYAGVSAHKNKKNDWTHAVDKSNIHKLTGHGKVRVGSHFRLHHRDKLFVMGDEDQLEVGLLRTIRNDLRECNGKTFFVAVVKIHLYRAEMGQPNNGTEEARVSPTLTVGSSRAMHPHCTPNVSAKARRITMQAKTRCPALQRPRMSIEVLEPLVMTTR